MRYLLTYRNTYSSNIEYITLSSIYVIRYFNICFFLRLRSLFRSVHKTKTTFNQCIHASSMNVLEEMSMTHEWPMNNLPPAQSTTGTESQSYWSYPKQIYELINYTFSVDFIYNPGAPRICEKGTDESLTKLLLVNKSPFKSGLLFLSFDVFIWIRWYPAKRAFPATLTHGRKGPFGRIPSTWFRMVCPLDSFECKWLTSADLQFG